MAGGEIQQINEKQEIEQEKKKKVKISIYVLTKIIQ